jgi:hypothetical protein
LVGNPPIKRALKMSDVQMILLIGSVVFGAIGWVIGREGFIGGAK